MNYFFGGSPRKSITVCNLPIDHEKIGLIFPFVFNDDIWDKSIEMFTISKAVPVCEEPSVGCEAGRCISRRDRQILGKINEDMLRTHGVHMARGSTLIRNSDSPQIKTGLGSFNRRYKPRSLCINYSSDIEQRGVRSSATLISLPAEYEKHGNSQNEQPPFGRCVPVWRLCLGGLFGGVGVCSATYGKTILSEQRSFIVLGESGTIIFLTGQVDCRCQYDNRYCQDSESHIVNVSQKVLTSPYFPYYNNDMANVLNTDKQIASHRRTGEGSSIRSIERMTGVHRDTIMRLGVKVGQGCTALMDATMRNLPCTRLEMDEIWGFVGKKERNVRRRRYRGWAAFGRSARSMPKRSWFRRSRSASATRRRRTLSWRMWRAG